MSTNTNTYLMLGVSFPFNMFSEAQREDGKTVEPYLGEPVNGLQIVEDGMSGQYLYIGRVLAKSDEYGQVKKEVSINPLDLPGYAEELADKIVETFGEILPPWKLEPRLLVFTHYS